MSRLRVVAVLMVVSLSPGITARAGAQEAPTATPPADTALDRRVREVAGSLRCPVCQNLSILDSPSELAQAMTRVVREQLAAGKTPDEVQRYFVARYGEWVLLKPPARGANLAVWVLPFVAIVIGGLFVGMAVRRWVRQGAATPPLAAAAATLDSVELRVRRDALVGALAELDRDLAEGRLAAADHAALQQRDTADLNSVREAIKQAKKPAPAPAPGVRAATVPPAASRRVRPLAAWGLGVVGFGVLATFALRGALAPRSPTGAITGVELSGGPAPEGADVVDTARVHALETRVARDSNDHAALIELGHLYLEQQRLPRAAQVNLKAVQLRPDAPESAEAFAHLGMILWSADELAKGLQALDKALFLHPDMPEALLYKGIMLFAGSQDPRGAVAAWERYLQVAPPGANTARVRAMLESARAAR